MPDHSYQKPPYSPVQLLLIAAGMRRRFPVVLMMAAVVSAMAGCGNMDALADQDASGHLSNNQTVDYFLPTVWQFPEQHLRRVTDRLKRYERQLDDRGNNEKAAQVRSTVVDIVDLNAETGLPQTDSVRLHVVGVHEGARTPRGLAEVLVTDTSSPIILCVCAYNSLKWSIRAAEGVRLQKVIIAGYEPQSVREVPDGVPVKGRLQNQTGSRYRFDAYSRAADWIVVDRHLRQLTGLAVSTRQGMYRYEGPPLVVGPENSEWLAAMKLNLLKDLTLEAMIHNATHNESEVLNSVAPMLVKSGGPSVSVAVGTVAGPITETMQTVAGTIHRLAHDPEYGLFTLHDYGVATLDPETGQLTPLELPDLEPINGDWPLAVDTCRHRLYVWGANGLHSIDLTRLDESAYDDDDQPSQCESKNSSALQLHRRGNSGNILSMVYCDRHKCLYGICAPYDGGSGTNSPVTVIQRLNLRGADVSQIRIDEPILFTGRPELRVVDDRLLVTCQPTAQKPEVSYAIDLNTGHLLFTCRHKAMTNHFFPVTDGASPHE